MPHAPGLVTRRISSTTIRFLLPLGLVGLAACAQPVAPARTADEAAIQAVSVAWKSAFNAGDAAAVVALYADDAVLSAPGEPAVRGKAAIREYFEKKAAQFSAAGVTVTDAPLGSLGTSGDLGFQWETYRVTDRSGTVVDAGKLLTLFQRRHGRWEILGDTWNSDGTAGGGAAQGAQTAVAPK